MQEYIKQMLLFCIIAASQLSGVATQLLGVTALSEIMMSYGKFGVDLAIDSVVPLSQNNQQSQGPSCDTRFS